MIIRYTLPPNSPKTYETEENSIIFGRHPKPGQHVDLDLAPDSYVSKRHARLTYEDGEYWIEDLGSENGTWMNEVKISEKTRLRLGSKIRLGWTIIELQKKQKKSSTRVFEPIRRSNSEDDSFLGPTREEEAEATIVRVADETGPPPTLSGKVEPEPIHGSESEDDLLAEPSQEPEAKATIVRMLDETERPAILSGKVETDTASMPVWQKLNFLNEFSQALGKTATLDGLGQILTTQLPQAIPGAQRGGLLLPDEHGELLLKAHWPKGDYSVSITLIKQAFYENESFIWRAPTSVEGSVGVDISNSVLHDVGKSAIYAPLLVGGEVLGVVYVDNLHDHHAFSSVDLEILKILASQVAMFIKDRVLRPDQFREETLRSNLLRQFSPKVAEIMLEKAYQLRRGGERVDPVTILVSDVRNFTALSAKMEPDDVVRMVNEMFDAFVPIISEYDGVVDKYVGDSILAVFGSPEHDLQQREKAVRAALDMQRAIHILGEGRKVRRLPVFHVGIGVHSGEAIHGFIGSAERLEFTVIGDTVNRASRYCDGAGPGDVFISKAVYEHVFRLVNVHPKTVKTKHPEVEPDLEGYVVTGLKKEKIG